MKKGIALLLLLILLVTSVSAFAEDAAIQTLPLDLTPGLPGDPAAFTEDGYSDASLTITLEKIVEEDGTVFNIARIKIADASQLRTAIASRIGTEKTGNKANKISNIAKKNNAILAIGGDYYGNDNKGYVVRQGEVLLKTPQHTRDMLIIDTDGNFHFIEHTNKTDYAAALKEIVTDESITIANVFNFGPILVKDGEVQEMPEKYSYNLNGREPRTAFGQTGELEYLAVVVDAVKRDGKSGSSVKRLAQFMADQGCLQAYNLDGGNSALMYFNGENYSNKSHSAERTVSDIIYFSTAIDFTGENAE